MAAAIVSQNFRGCGKLGDDSAPHPAAEGQGMNQRQARLSGIGINAVGEPAPVFGSRD